MSHKDKSKLQNRDIYPPTLKVIVKYKCSKILSSLFFFNVCVCAKSNLAGDLDEICMEIGSVETQNDSGAPSLPLLLAKREEVLAARTEA